MLALVGKMFLSFFVLASHPSNYQISINIICLNSGCILLHCLTSLKFDGHTHFLFQGPMSYLLLSTNIYAAFAKSFFHRLFLWHSTSYLYSFAHWLLLHHCWPSRKMQLESEFRKFVNKSYCLARPNLLRFVSCLQLSWRLWVLIFRVLCWKTLFDPLILLKPFNTFFCTLKI